MQSDLSLCLSLEYSTSVQLLNEHHLGVQSLSGRCTGLSASTMSKCHIVGSDMLWLIYVVEMYVCMFMYVGKFHPEIRFTTEIQLVLIRWNMVGFIVIPPYGRDH